MTLKLISPNSEPTFIALSTDISGSKILGASLIGKTVFTTDDNKWYIIKEDLTLKEYVIRSSSGYTDTSGSSHGYIDNNGSPQITSVPILQATAQGDVSGKSPFTNTNTLTFPCRAEIYNVNGNVTNNSVEVRFMCIVRLGELFSNTQNSYISTNTTTILKYGAGILRRIIVTDNVGVVTLIDGIGTGTTIAVIDAAKVIGSVQFDTSFSNGLTVVTGTNAKCTVVYE
jgi:hypothetical protein